MILMTALPVAGIASECVKMHSWRSTLAVDLTFVEFSPVQSFVDGPDRIRVVDGKFVGACAVKFTPSKDQNPWKIDAPVRTHVP